MSDRVAAGAAGELGERERRFAGPRRERYDVVVVGARAAGAATAMLLARSGARVLLVDRGEYGSDTLSTHALMRGAVVQLARWGLLERLLAGSAQIVRETTFWYGDEPVRIELQPKHGIDGLVAPRRTTLDPLLADAAREAGVEVLFGARATALRRAATGRVVGAVIEVGRNPPRAVAADLVIGADGVRSTVARAVVAPTVRVARNASGMVYGYWRGIGLPGYHWFYSPGCSVGLIPTDDGFTCLFGSMPAEHLRERFRGEIEKAYLATLARLPEPLGAKLRSAERVERLRGFAGTRGFFRRAWGPGWALVGDAGYFKDPITAHGLTDALRDAELLAEAVGQGTETALAAYEKARDDLSLELFDATDAVAGYDWTLDQVRALHARLAEAMKREVATLVAEWPSRGVA